MGTKRLGQARFETLAKSLNKRDGGIPIPVAELNPAQWHHFFDDFHAPDFGTDLVVGGTTIAAGIANSSWDATLASGGSLLLDIAKVGGQVKLLNDTTDNDVINMQAIGAGFKFASSKKLWFEAKLNIADASQSGYFIGLASNSGGADPHVLAGGSGGTFIDAVGFTMVDGSVAVTHNHVVAESSNETVATTGNTCADDTEVTLSIYWDGTNYFYYVDGTLGTSPVNTNTPDDVVVFPTIEFANRSGHANFMHVDYIRVVQER